MFKLSGENEKKEGGQSGVTALTVVGVTTAAIGALSLLSRIPLNGIVKKDEIPTGQNQYLDNVTNALTNAGKENNFTFSIFNFGRTDKSINSTPNDGKK